MKRLRSLSLFTDVSLGVLLQLLDQHCICRSPRYEQAMTESGVLCGPVQQYRTEMDLYSRIICHPPSHSPLHSKICLSLAALRAFCRVELSLGVPTLFFARRNFDQRLQRQSPHRGIDGGTQQGLALWRGRSLQSGSGIQLTFSLAKSRVEWCAVYAESEQTSPNIMEVARTQCSVPFGR